MTVGIRPRQEVPNHARRRLQAGRLLGCIWSVPASLLTPLFPLVLDLSSLLSLTSIYAPPPSTPCWYPASPSVVSAYVVHVKREREEGDEREKS